MNKISTDGVGSAIGYIILKDSHHGLSVKPNLRELAPGNHAFHIHEKPSCEPGVKDGEKVAGLMAGGHFDPTNVGHAMKHDHSKKHSGHMKPHGDLPQLVAGVDGTSTSSVMTKNLKVSQLLNRSIMVHKYGENDPGKPRGGGPRVACGIITK
ncbi:MAG: superoxide dismutase family protein [Pseudomonadota bacterium]|nr:superoxide dismutase family protein [Pseudomonadota bacterium]